MADKNPPTHVSSGREYFDASQGRQRAQELLDGLDELLPGLADFVTTHGFDALYTRPGLTLQQRQLITVVAVATQGGVEHQLKAHLDAALNLGISEEELRETLLHISLYVGMPRAMQALAALKDVLADRQI